MSQDFTKDLFFSALKEHIEEQHAEGKTGEEILSKMDEQKIENAYSALIEQMTKDCIATLHDSLYERVLQGRANNAHFVVHNEQIWQKCFVASEMMYLIVLEAAEDYRKIFNELPDEQKREMQYRYITICQLHGRACQQYLEILCLLKAGFADGAFARWRSMYELCVVAQFIKQNDESVAKAYYEQSFAEQCEYEWAKTAPCFKDKDYIRFRDILNKCKSITKKWEDQYGLSNKTVHSAPQGTFARLGKPQDLDIVAVGPSDYGLAMPAVNSAIVLAIISALYFTLLHSGDGVLYARVATTWVDKIRDVYSEIEENCFSHD